MHKKFFLLSALFALIACKQSQVTLKAIEGTQLAITDSLAQDQEVLDYIAPYQKHISEEMSAVLAYAPQSHSKTEGPYNTAIGNMMADAVYELSNPIFKKRTGNAIDGVLLNHGGIRSTLNAGEVTMRTAYDIMPFENSIIVVELTADKVRDMFTYLKSGKAHPIANMQLVLTEDDSIVKATVNGKPVEDGQTYFIATNDYLRQGGDGMVFFADPVSETVLDYKVRSVLIDYFKEKDTIAPVRDNRFIKE
ncbi:5'-nucleotidase C-terminal domain-containing protein [Leeuwenhoekiella parthenopeia]|uniref:5'-nucleotidase C-terminal domain-containing protein n=1 Tax=Leeuwenhoekiella parthenopeia TaxID=2890320 RepID=A0ABS8GQY1_9FLAO|nr:5'-nucleotidase [Leeuwenhoekiella parthenopeia]MCC4212370.1 5'-nucleotidase C-terminal domain-containing protein [Leeuwenhoekiella parthenopeia]